MHHWSADEARHVCHLLLVQDLPSDRLHDVDLDAGGKVQGPNKPYRKKPWDFYRGKT